MLTALACATLVIVDTPAWSRPVCVIAIWSPAQPVAHDAALGLMSLFSYYLFTVAPNPETLHPKP